MRAVPITAYAVCNALGADTETVVEALLDGRSGLGSTPDGRGTEGRLCFELGPLPRSLARFDSRHARLAAHVTGLAREPIEAACRRWGAQRVGLLVGSSTAGLVEAQLALEAGSASSTRVGNPDAPMQLTLGVLQQVSGARGPAFAIGTDCSASGKALGSARRLIASGLVDAVVVVGVDTVCDVTRRVFDALGGSSARPCRPLSKQRAGLNLGEGAALVLLERRGTADLALHGVGEANDARDAGAPEPSGPGMRAAIWAALEQAGVSSQRVGHVNVHATGSPRGDLAEARALHEVFGERITVVATKGYTGHLLAAAGVTGVVFTALALERGWLPSSSGASPIDPEIDLRVTCDTTWLESDYAMSTSFGRGGSNVAVLLGVRDR